MLNIEKQINEKNFVGVATCECILKIEKDQKIIRLLLNFGFALKKKITSLNDE